MCRAQLETGSSDGICVSRHLCSRRRCLSSLLLLSLCTFCVLLLLLSPFRVTVSLTLTPVSFRAPGRHMARERQAAAVALPQHRCVARFFPFCVLGRSRARLDLMQTAVVVRACRRDGRREFNGPALACRGRTLAHADPGCGRAWRSAAARLSMQRRACGLDGRRAAALPGRLRA